LTALQNGSRIGTWIEFSCLLLLNVFGKFTANRIAVVSITVVTLTDIAFHNRVQVTDLLGGPMSSFQSCTSKCTIGSMGRLATAKDERMQNLTDLQPLQFGSSGQIEVLDFSVITGSQ
jgi:hypothetical protein